MALASTSLRSWILGAVALAFGLGLYVYDDWCEQVQIPIAKTILNGLEIIVMGPAMAVLAFLLSERLRVSDLLHRRQLAEEREQRFRFLGWIAMSMAHEVKNPLHNLHLVTNELDLRAAGDDHRLIGNLRQNLERLDRATRLIYALARPPRPSSDEDLQPVEVTALLDEVVAEAQGRAERQAAVDAVPAATPVHADGDREAMRIVLSNLMRNAIEAADGGPVTVRCFEESAATVVVIRNQGTMPPEVAVESDGLPSRKPGGLGVGIAIARHLAAALRGRLRFSSDAGWVSARLELPRAR
jgi:signal transduction histidine kinase